MEAATSSSDVLAIAINSIWERLQRHAALVGYIMHPDIERVMNSGGHSQRGRIDAASIFFLREAAKTIEPQHRWRYELNAANGDEIRVGTRVKPGVPRAFCIELFGEKPLQDIEFQPGRLYVVRGIEPIWIDGKPNGQYRFRTTCGEAFLVDRGIFNFLS